MTDIRKKVVIATLLRLPGTGVYGHTQSLVDGFRERGIPAIVRTPTSGGRMWIPIFALRPLLIHHLNRNWSMRWHLYWHYVALRGTLRKELKRNHPAAIIAQDPFSAAAALAARRKLGLDFRVVLVCHFNGSMADELRMSGDLDDERACRKIVNLEKRALEEVDDVIYVSKWIKGIVERARGIYPQRSHVIWNGVSTRSHLSRSYIDRSSFGFSQDDLVLINVGSLEPRKNQTGLVRFFHELSTLYSNVRLLLVGGGETSKLRAEIKAVGLEQEIHLLGARTDVPALLDLSDIYIHYAVAESLPLVLLEAARAGLPSAAVPVGGIAEFQAVVPGSIALNFADEGESIAALRPLLDDPELRASSGRQAREAFHEHFTQERMVRAFAETLGLMGCGVPTGGEV